jgi:hypothetical protein
MARIDCSIFVRKLDNSSLDNGSGFILLPSNVRDQRRRAVGAPLAGKNLWEPLAIPASGVTTSDDRCIA